MKKPDATTVITPENYREKAWSLPVSDLLYVGPATAQKLNRYGITTIGGLAQASVDFLYWLLGKNGVMLHQFANGQDHSGVRRYYAVQSPRAGNVQPALVQAKGLHLVGIACIDVPSLG